MPEHADGMPSRPLRDMLRRHRLRHPAQSVAAAFAVGILVGSVLLALPAARPGPGAAPLHVATASPLALAMSRRLGLFHFPVLVELVRRPARAANWTLHTKLTMT